MLLDIHEIAYVADFFVICSGSSERMLNALLDAVVDEIRDSYKVKPKVEGQPEDGWLLADYGDLIVHLFSPDQRDYYQLEDLWSEGKVLLRLQ